MAESEPDIEDAAEIEPEPEPEPEPESEPEPERHLVVESEALLSDAVSSASIDAMSKLAKASEPEPVSTTGLKFSEPGRTVEDIVVEMLRPLLREWLDTNLPIIVDRIVQKEIRKLVRQAEPD